MKHSTEVRNLTPHEITIVDPATNNPVISYPSEGIARAKMRDEVQDYTVNGTPVVKKVFGEPEDLPEPLDGTMLIVSLATAQAAERAGRTTDDLLMSANPVRDESGRIIGCTAFSQL